MNLTTIARRQFTSQLVKGTLIVASNISMLSKAKLFDSNEIDWVDVQDLGVEGKGWNDTEGFYDRLPQKAKELVREPVWELSKDSAGMCFRFNTDSPNIQVKYTLRKENLAMPHMPATGVSGLDLYAHDDQGIDRWVSVVFPTKQVVESSIAENLKSGSRQYSIYLPLYNGVESLEIGVDRGASFEGLAPRKDKPILFYGTSIMQGACASRPGLAIPAILGRRLKVPTINLGFSGNGRMEPEVGSLLAELDPCTYVIDCLPNMYDETVSQRAAPLVRQLRKAHSETPILLVEDRSFTNSPFFPERKVYHHNNRIALKKAFNQLKEDGMEHLYYLSGENLLGLDGEAATDGSHPNDLGMVRYANAFEPALRAMLNQF